MSGQLAQAGAVIATAEEQTSLGNRTRGLALAPLGIQPCQLKVHSRVAGIDTLRPLQQRFSPV